MPTCISCASSLGVRCDFCHVAENEKFELDDKREKQTARRMITMVADINQANFEGRTTVTCLTCHRGSHAARRRARPASGAVRRQHHARRPSSRRRYRRWKPCSRRTTAPPAATRRVRCARATAPARISSRFSSTPTRPEPAWSPARERSALEIFQKSPDKILITARHADGTTERAVSTAPPPGSRRRAACARSAPRRPRGCARWPIRPATFACANATTDLRVAGRDTLRDHAAIVVQGLDDANRRVRFSFDERERTAAARADPVPDSHGRRSRRARLRRLPPHRSGERSLPHRHVHARRLAPRPDADLHARARRRADRRRGVRSPAAAARAVSVSPASAH